MLHFRITDYYWSLVQLYFMDFFLQFRDTDYFQNLPRPRIMDYSDPPLTGPLFMDFTLKGLYFLNVGKVTKATIERPESVNIMSFIFTGFEMDSTLKLITVEN